MPFRKYIKEYQTAIRLFGLILGIATVILAGLWASDPDGNYEPFTLILGTLSAVLLALPSFVRTPISKDESHSERNEKSISEMRADEVFDIVQNSDPEQDWIRADDMNEWRIYHRKYPQLRFVRPRNDPAYIQSEDFMEPWARQPFADPHAVGYFYELRLNDSLLKQFILISVDGGRALLPLPNSYQDLTVSPLEAKVAVINDEANQTREYFQRAGLEISSEDV